MANPISTPARDRLLTRAEAAEFLGIKPQTLAIWLCNGRYSLPCVKIGALAKYRLRDLEKFIESRTVGGGAE